MVLFGCLYSSKGAQRIKQLVFLGYFKECHNEELISELGLQLQQNFNTKKKKKREISVGSEGQIVPSRRL